jgi:hypothetical protein
MPPKFESKLTDEARAELAEAIRIVREDRFENYVRGRLTGPPTDPNPGPGDPPPPKPGDPVNPGPKKKGLYWGEEE